MEASIRRLQADVPLPAGKVERMSEGVTLHSPYWISNDEISRDAVLTMWANVLAQASHTHLWPIIFQDEGTDFGEMIGEPGPEPSEHSVRFLLEAIRSRWEPWHVPPTPPPIDRLARAGNDVLPVQRGQIGGYPEYQLVLLEANSAVSAAGQLTPPDARTLILASWVQRFDGAVLQIGVGQTILLVRRRPASLEEAKLLVREMEIAGARNDDGVDAADYMQLGQWNLTWR